MMCSVRTAERDKQAGAGASAALEHHGQHMKLVVAGTTELDASHTKDNNSWAVLIPPNIFPRSTFALRPETRCRVARANLAGR